MPLQVSIVNVRSLTGDARPRFFESHYALLGSRCGAREAMTVGCKSDHSLFSLSAINLDHLTYLILIISMCPNSSIVFVQFCVKLISRLLLLRQSAST